MNRAIEYYYDIYPDIINENENYYSFLFNSNEYIFSKCNRSNKDINIIIEISSDLKKLGYKCHEIVNNIFNKAITNIKNEKYILLKVLSKSNEPINIFNIIFDEKKHIINSSYNFLRPNWKEVWQKRIDYLEKQMQYYGLNKVGIIDSFSYYIGLSENAIIFYNNIINLNSSLICLSHRRIFCPNIWLNYGNPLSFMVDVPERDVAEYLKSQFFYGNYKECYLDFDSYLKSKKMSLQSAQLLLARLLYPSYYFDAFERVIIDKKSEENVIKIIERRKNYEKFLKYCYLTLSKKFLLTSFPQWLL